MLSGTAAQRHWVPCQSWQVAGCSLPVVVLHVLHHLRQDLHLLQHTRNMTSIITGSRAAPPPRVHAAATHAPPCRQPPHHSTSHHATPRAARIQPRHKQGILCVTDCTTSWPCASAGGGPRVPGRGAPLVPARPARRDAQLLLLLLLLQSLCVRASAACVASTPLLQGLQGVAPPAECG